MALNDDTEYPEKSGAGYEAMRMLYERIKELSAQAYAEDEDEA